MKIDKKRYDSAVVIQCRVRQKEAKARFEQIKKDHIRKVRNVQLLLFIIIIIGCCYKD